MHKKILVAYDGSVLSRQAIETAKYYASQDKSIEIHVVSVIETTGPHTNIHMKRNIMNELKEKMQPQMDKIAEEFMTKNITIKTDILSVEHKENPGGLLCEYANSNNIDLIIMGCRGLGNIRQVILGSVSNNVVQNANCSVLIIKS